MYFLSIVVLGPTLRQMKIPMKTLCPRPRPKTRNVDIMTYVNLGISKHIINLNFCLKDGESRRENGIIHQDPLGQPLRVAGLVYHEL